MLGSVPADPRDTAILPPMTDAELIQRIKDAALLRGEFTLRSGRKSNYYLDKYLFETQPDILAELGRRFAARVTPEVTRLAGAELGGIPLVAAASLASGLPSVLVRNQKKDYGTARQIEGRLDAGDHVMIVEDIATTGGQVLEAARTLQERGAKISTIVAVIDRQEGARENIESAGLAFDALLTKADLGL
jgi:orotate phosphoribosyltransferase